jgi:hypothetical protein
VLHYTSREKINRVVKRSQNRLRVADASSAYLPLTSGLEDAAAMFADVKSLLRPIDREA